MSDQPQVLLFGPQTGKDLRRQYPELANVPEFKKLTLQEMLFVWHYANPTSPIASENNDRIRRTKAYAAAFKEEDTLREEKYQAGNFPDSVKIAIEKMRQYDPSVRVRARRMVEKIVENFEKLVEVDLDQDFKKVSKDKDGGITEEVDFSARQNYINSCSKIAETLPRLIGQMEDGFGISDSESGEESATKAIDRFHLSKDNE